MYKFIKQRLVSILILMTLSMNTLAASTPTDTQISAVLSILSNFITSRSAKTIALEKVSDYATSNGTTDTPTVEDYDDVGVLNVDARILVAVNEAVANSTFVEVDTDTELQILIDEVLATAPILTLIGNSVISLALNSTYIEDNATALDNIDGDISANIIITGMVNTSIEGNYTISYNVSDEDNNSAIEVNRTITISSTVDITPPVITGTVSDYNVTVDENQLFAIEINATDDYTIRYSIEDGNSSLFDIDVATGIVTFKVAPNYESGIHIYTFTAIASDGSGTDSNISVIINIRDVDEIPPEFHSDANVTVDENSIIAIELNATDIDPVTYSISGGDSALFTIVSSTGVVSFNPAVDYDTSTQHTYTFVATATDGLNSTDQTVIITINDLNDEVPTWNINGVFTVTEEEQSGTIILDASDLDTGSQIVYSIKDGNASGNSEFLLDASTGLVSFRVLPDYESGKILYSFIAIASDGIHESSELNVTININNTKEAELKKTGQTTSYDENGNAVNNNNDDGFYEKGQIARYSRSASGIVSDHTLGLEWKDDDTLVLQSATSGDAYCTSFSLGGHSDWRLPTYDELESLIDYGVITNFKVFPSDFSNVEEGAYWTSIEYLLGNTRWSINSQDGSDRTSDTSAYVICVRTFATVINY